MSSESEEENLHLKEAIDAKFIQDDMFKTDKKPQSKQPPELKSLRPSKIQDDCNVLGVTPQFQDYVAKQLSIQLEEKLEKIMGTTKSPKKVHRRLDSCVKLLNDSVCPIEIAKGERLERKRKKHVREEDCDNERRCREVVVEPADVLSKKDTKHWSNRSKAPVFRYKKMKNGILNSLD